MKKLALIIGALSAIMFASTVYAADSYWVFGSFKNINYAMKEAERIRSASGGLEIQVVSFDVAGASHNRLLLRKDGNANIQQVIQAVGIVPWSLEDESAVQRVDIADQREVREVREAREPEIKIAYKSLDVTPPRAGESYLMYCIKKANPEERRLYCTDAVLKTKFAMTGPWRTWHPGNAAEKRVATAG